MEVSGDGASYVSVVWSLSAYTDETLEGCCAFKRVGVCNLLGTTLRAVRMEQSTYKLCIRTMGVWTPWT